MLLLSLAIYLSSPVTKMMKTWVVVCIAFAFGVSGYGLNRNVGDTGVAPAYIHARDDGEPAQEIPECSLECLHNSIERVTDCEHFDFGCLCQPHNVRAVQGDASECLLASCGEEAVKCKAPYSLRTEEQLVLSRSPI
jgi:hypothetical protein